MDMGLEIAKNFEVIRFGIFFDEVVERFEIDAVAAALKKQQNQQARFLVLLIRLFRESHTPADPS